MWILDILSSQLAHTPEEATTNVPLSDLSFVQNILEGEKMELVFDITHSMYQDASPFSLISSRREGILAPRNPTKERENWKGKCEAMELRCATL